MDIRQLRYFVRIIELKNFTKAAEQLRIAQPALGLQIRKLEEELQVQLLVRHSRGVEPTDAGRLLFERATEILQKVESARRELIDFAGPPRGRIVIGMTPSINFMLAAPLIRRCSADLPHVSLSVVEELSEVLTEWVDSDRLDMALAYSKGPTKTLNADPLLREGLYFVQNAASGGANAGPIPFREVAEHPLIMPGLPHGLRNLLEEAAARKEVQLKIAYEIQAVATARELAEQNIGYTVLPYGAIGRYVQEGRLVARKIIDPEITRTVCLIYAARRPTSKGEQALIQRIKEVTAAEIGKVPGVDLPVR